MRPMSRAYDAVHWILERVGADYAFTFTNADVERALGFPPRTASGALSDFVRAGLLAPCGKMAKEAKKGGGRPHNIYCVPDAGALRKAVEMHRFRKLHEGHHVTRKRADIFTGVEPAVRSEREPRNRAREITELSLQFAERVEAGLAELLAEHAREIARLQAQVVQAKSDALRDALDIDLWRELRRRKQERGDTSPLRHPKVLDR